MIALKNNISQRGFSIRAIKFGAAPVRGVKIPSWINRRNIDSVIGGIGAATGLSSLHESYKQKQEAREAARAARAERPAPLDETFPPERVSRAPTSHSDEPPSPSEQGRFFSSPAELDLHESSEFNFLDMLYNIDSDHLVLLSAVLILTPIIVNVVQFGFSSKLLNSPDIKEQLITMRAYARDYVKRSSIAIFLGCITALITSAISSELVEKGYELSFLEFLATLICIFFLLGAVVLILAKLLKKNR